MVTTAAERPAEPTAKYTEPEYIGELRAVFAELRDHYERAEEARAAGSDHEAQGALVLCQRPQCRRITIVRQEGEQR